MKKIKFLALMMLAGSLVFTSCSDDDETVPAPTISFSGGSSVVVPLTTDTNVVFAATITAEGEISTFGITEKKVEFDGTEHSTAYDATGTDGFKGETSKIYNFNETFNAASFIDGSITYEKILYVFSVTDKEGASLSKTYTVTLETASNGTPLVNEVANGVVWNVIGPNQGAWDLVADQGKSSGDAAADKDMINTTTAGSTTPDVFEKEWVAGNTTMFVKTSTTYANITTEEEAKTAYDAGTATATVSNIATGDIYVAKVRGAEDYTVIEITNVVVTSTDNLDKIEFKYKKK